MNKEVSFPIAKLLKEKKFEESCKKYFELALTSRKDKENGYSGAFGWKKGELNKQEGYFINNYPKIDYSSDAWFMCSAPTIAEVVMWLYEKYNIWISVTTCITGSDEWDYGYIITYLPKEFENVKRRATYLITKESFKESTGSYTGAWHLPTEAYEKAIEHALKKLI